MYRDALRLENANEEVELPEVKKKLQKFQIQEDMAEINMKN